MNTLKLFIFYTSYLYFLVMPVLLWLMFIHPRTGRGLKILSAIALVLINLAAWARFVEPRILLTKSHDVKICHTGEQGQLTAAVFSDTHNGLFGNAMPLERIVARVNAVQPDIILIPGDFTYYPSEEQLEDLLAPLADLVAPTFAVMGNHDEGIPGPSYIRPLHQLLPMLNVTVLDPGAVLFEKGDLQVAITGTRDHWAMKRDGEIPPKFTSVGKERAVITLQHNPALVLDEHMRGQFDLMVVGHTHGGQINLPFITCAFTFACDVSRYGLTSYPNGQLFVTSGTGMVGLPMRFNVPPVIDILNISFENCNG
ncbi:MAG: metallophosphoesterase [bacterium]